MEWDDDGYPTEELLERVKAWPYTDGWTGLLDLVGENWSYQDRWVKEGDLYRCSTGGWSGNEDLIYALMENRMFWACCWVSSRRGGGYEFEANDVSLTTKGEHDDRD